MAAAGNSGGGLGGLLSGLLKGALGDAIQQLAKSITPENLKNLTQSLLSAGQSFAASKNPTGQVGTLAGGLANTLGSVVGRIMSGEGDKIFSHLSGILQKGVGALAGGGGSAGGAASGAMGAASGAAAGVKMVTAAFGALSEAAGKVAEGANKAKAALTAWYTGISNAISALGAGMAEFVALTSPATVAAFNRALADTKAVIGQILTPALVQMTMVVRKVGDAIISLDAATKGTLGKLGASGGLAGGIAALAGAASVAFGALASIAGLIGTWASAALGFDEVSGQFKILNTVLKAVGSIVQAIAPFIQRFAEALATVLGPAIENVVNIIGPLIEAILGLLSPFQIYTTSILKFIGAILQATTPFGRLIGAILSLIGTVGSALGNVFGGALSKLGGLLEPLARFAEKVASAIEKLIEWLGELENKLREIAGLPAKFDPNARSSAGAAVRGAQIGDLQSAIRSAYTNAAQAGSGVQDIAKQQLKAMNGIWKSIDDFLNKANQKPVDEARNAGEADAEDIRRRMRIAHG